jgi:dihydrofolate reductase
MRRIVMFNWLTTDGYFAGPDGTLDWVVPEEEQAKAAARDIASFDTVLFGRRTYELLPLRSRCESEKRRGGCIPILTRLGLLRTHVERA